MIDAINLVIGLLNLFVLCKVLKHVGDTASFRAILKEFAKDPLLWASKSRKP